MEAQGRCRARRVMKYEFLFVELYNFVLNYLLLHYFFELFDFL